MDHGSRKFQEVKNVILSLSRENYGASILQLHNILTRPLFPATISFILDNVSFENRSEKDQCMIELLKVMFNSSKTDPSFPSLIIGLFENVLRRKQRLLDFIMNELQLGTEDQLQVAIILTTNENLRNYGIRLLKSRLNEFVKMYPIISPTLQQQFNYVLKEIQGQKEEPINEEYHVSPMFDRFDARNRNVSQEPQSEAVVSPIVTIIREIGFVATLNRKILRIIIKESQVNLNEKIVGDLIMMMVATASNQDLSNIEKFKSFLRQKNREKLIKEVKNLPNCWNMGVFVDTINELFPALNFGAICECFDNGYFQVRSPPSFNLVVDFFHRNRQALGKFILRRHWKSGITQATFIYFSLMSRLTDFQSIEFSQVDLGELRNMQGMNVRTPWMNLELVSCLLRLTESDSEDNFARNMFEYPMLHNKIQLLCGVAQSGVENGVSFDIMSELLGPFIQVNGQFNVVAHVSRLNSRMVTKALFVMYNKDTRLCGRVVDVLQENRDMIGLLSYQPYHLSLTLTMVAARRSIVNAREIIMGVMERGMRFVHDALVFLRSMVQNPNSFGIPEPLTKEEYNLIFSALSNCGNMSVMKVIQEFSDYVNHMGDERYKNIRLPQSVLSLHPPQQAPQHHSPPPPPGGSNADFQINEIVEKWSTKFFETMFAGGRTVGESLQKLREYKEDGSAESQQKYATLIHNMFDEFRFFDQYPATQLRIMAEFFGRAISEELLHGKTLKYALVYVMKSLIDHNNPNYYSFGKTSLSKFKHRLYEWKEFIFQMQVENLLTQAPDFAKYLKAPLKEVNKADRKDNEYHSDSESSRSDDGENEMEEGDEEEGEEDDEEEEQPRSPTSNIPTKSGFLNIKILNLFQRNYTGKKPEEEEETQFRFLMNNLTENNAVQKAEEFLALPQVEEHFDFYAMLLVANRVCLEANNADMYAKFLDCVEKLSSKFFKSVMKMTFAIIKYIYKSEKISRDMSERQLFKTIGNWLGMITVARNRPIFKRELDVKELIIQSYNTGKLTATVPFVCRWLNCCQFSTVLKPPNPWIMCIIRLLGEVHAVEELKLNIKFDIEMMCKTLSIRLSELDKDGILDTTVPFVRSKANPDRREIHSNKNFQMEFDMSKVQLPETTLDEIESKIVITPGVEIFTQYPHLRPVIVVAMDQAIKEIIAAVVKRSVMVASRTTLDLVTKDFCPERDISKLTSGAHNMVQNLASSLSMVTCKQPLQAAMENGLKRYLLAMLTVKPSAEIKRRIEDTAKRVTAENIHVGCFYVERMAIERAKQDVNRALENEVQQRRKHHESGNRLPWTMYHRIFQEALIHAPKLPEVLLPTVKMGGLQKNVYAGFPKLTEECREKNQVLSPYSELFAHAEQLIKEVIEVVKRNIPAPGVERSQQTIILADRNYQEITKKLISLIQTAPNVFEFSVEVQRSIISRFYTCNNRFVKDVFIFLMERIQSVEGNERLGDMAFLFWSHLEEEKKFCYDTIILLLGNAFPLENFDMELSKVLKTTDNHDFLQFGLKSYEILAHPTQGADLPKTFKVLMKRRDALEQDLKARLEILAQPFYQQGGNGSSRPAPPRTEGGPPVSAHQRVTEMITRRQFIEASPEKRNEFVEKFVNYIEMYENVVAQRNYPNSHKLNLFVKNDMQESNLVSSDGDFAELVSLLFSECVKYYVQKYKESTPLSGYRYMDAFTSLIGVFLRASKFDKMVLRLEMVLNIVSSRLIEEHKVSVNPSPPQQPQLFFHQKPYLRFFSNLLVEMNQQEDNDQKDLIKKFSHVFYKLEPNKVPGFVFGWMDLICHRCFLPKLLLTTNHETYAEFHELIIRLFTFIHPFLWKGQLTMAVKQIYKGILRILLVLLHDFSEFLCVYHFSLIDAIPPNCIQIRNVILSAFPRHMKLPDPFTPNLKVDLLPEINISPKILSNYERSIDEAELTEKIKQYLFSNGRNPQVLEEIKNRFMYKMGENKETKYDITLINSVVLYVGIQTIDQVKEKRQNVMNSVGVGLFVHLTRELDYEGRYHFFNAFMNQLRYPNSHSHFFSCVILYLYASSQANPEPEKDSELIAEQITRVLLERLIVNRPHPWGLLITFIELVKNTTFDFWNKKFIHCAPSIERLFTNVGRSCLRNVNVSQRPIIGNQQGGSGGDGGGGSSSSSIVMGQDGIQEGIKKK